MYNQVFLVGRLAQMPDYEIINNYRKDALIHIMVYRPFDEVKGCRDYDLVPIILWRGLAEMINDTCHVGSVIAVKGRLNVLKTSPIIKDIVSCLYVQSLSRFLMRSSKNFRNR